MDNMGCLDNGFHEDNHKEESVRMRSTFIATGKTLRAYTGSILVINTIEKSSPPSVTFKQRNPANNPNFILVSIHTDTEHSNKSPSVPEISVT